MPRQRSQWQPVMQAVRVLLPLSSMVCLLFACGTSSEDSNGSDGGRRGDSSVHFSDAKEICNAFGAPTCAAGNTCCFSGLSGICKELSSCTSSLQFECGGPDNCRTGEVCCASIPVGLDASVLSLDRDAEAGLGLIGVTATSFCSSSCSWPSSSICKSNADCSNGASCTLLPEGDLVLLVLGAETLAVCAQPDGGDFATGDAAPEGGE